MLRFIISHITSIRYIIKLIKHSPDNPPKVKITDEYYSGIDGEKVPLRIFHPSKAKKLSIIIFPGASPSAEQHPGIINLASIIASLGFKVFIPRIPPLKELNITDVNIEWFAHAYEQLLIRDDICNENVTITGISFGGSLLLNAILDKRMNNPKPKSLMIYGSAFNIDTGFEFLLNGEINHNGQMIKIKPNEWGGSVIMHNFLSNIDTGFDTAKIRQALSYRMADDLDKLSEFKDTLNSHDKEFIDSLLNVEYNDEIKKIIYQIIDNEKENLAKVSPKNLCHKIDNKIFIMHGANDSMVPFTESVLMHDNIKNSELLISYLYEHKEISTKRGMFFKLYELLRMEFFFASYFRYNEN
tara:strand:- start:9907 stop:10974 length:1068 start_codon:yes stop_codon:yes gene_type:complete